ncbi:hypothetical protein LTR78_007906 [Recurvomyces mirabilis]|uniref:Uncharacterized protein n=1 Tax=Recurvomyces mirabilis TaxID=574656 RepID=A0AAE0WJ22_9PEZI|nr:hypothetical protein LTR78_007906 [Recurvomyces mirabilis]KAK5152441.1 hypothetical protein LTS14_008388 [Recurvomyces mirabilis]
MGLFHHSKKDSTEENVTVQEIKGDDLSTTTTTSSSLPTVVKIYTIHDNKSCGRKEHIQDIWDSNGQPAFIARYKRPMMHPNEINLHHSSTNSSSEEVLATCRLHNWSENFFYHLGPNPDLTEKNLWPRVQGSCLTMKAWKFTTPLSPNNGQQRSLEWRRTHDKSIGATRWGQRDHKLVDVETGEVLGVFVYMCKAFGRSEAWGRVEFFYEVEEGTEVQALIVLLGAQEAIRRSEMAAANGAGS